MYMDGNKIQKHKKQPWGNVECFAFGCATVRFASLETSFHVANHTVPPPPSYEGLPLCPKDKNHSPFHGEKPLKIVIYRLKAICQYSKRHSVGTCLWHVSMQTSNVSAHWKHDKGMSLSYNAPAYCG